MDDNKQTIIKIILIPYYYRERDITERGTERCGRKGEKQREGEGIYVTRAKDREKVYTKKIEKNQFFLSYL